MSLRRPNTPSDTRRPTPAVDAAGGGEATGGGAARTGGLWWVKTIASWVLLGAAVAALAALVVVPRLTGSTAYTVLTGSMEPGYPPGTLIVAKPTPGDQINPGDVVTFQPESGNPAVVTHRVVSVFYSSDGQRQFVTKGDANNATDQPIIGEQIRGKMLYSVPYLGRVNTLISGSSRSVLVFVIAGALGIYALWMWLSGLRDARRGRRGDQIDDPDETGGPAVEPIDLSATTPVYPAAAEAATTAFAAPSSVSGAPHTPPRHAAPDRAYGPAGAPGSVAVLPRTGPVPSDTEITVPIPVTL